MILKLGGSGGTIKVSDAPKITYSGRWLKWHLEFYGDALYWEAWFLTSGTLTVEGSYTADAWGIGGGSACTANHYMGSVGGSTNMVLGAALNGSIAVSIGAGGSSYEDDGGSTTLGNKLTCAGGIWVYDGDGSQATTRYRFGDADKAGEAGEPFTERYLSAMCGGGWLHHKVSQISGSDRYYTGEGYGAGGSYDMGGQAGALVIRIPA